MIITVFGVLVFGWFCVGGVSSFACIALMCGGFDTSISSIYPCIGCICRHLTSFKFIEINGLSIGNVFIAPTYSDLPLF